MNLLLIEEQPGAAAELTAAMGQTGFAPNWVFTTPGIETRTQLKRDVDLIFLCYNHFPVDGCRSLVEALQNAGLSIPFIVYSRITDPETLVTCMKSGASDYLIPGQAVRLAQVINQTGVNSDAGNLMPGYINGNGHKPAISEVVDTPDRHLSYFAINDPGKKPFSNVFKMIPVPMAISVLEDGRFLDANDEYCKLAGCTREYLLSHTSYDLGMWPDLESRSAWVDRLRKDRRIQPHEEKFFTPSGQEVYAISSSELIEYDGLNCVLILYFNITERKQTEITLRENEKALGLRAKQLALINEIGRQISSVLDVKLLLETAAIQIHERFGYQHVAIFTIDKQNQDLVLKAHHGGLVGGLENNYRQKVGEGMIGKAAQTGQRQLSNDVRTNPVYIKCLPTKVETISELCLPISIADQVLGVVDIQSPNPNAFDASDVTVLETLANQLAIAFENARLVGEFRCELNERVAVEEKMNGQVRRLAALRDIAMAITASLDLRITLQIILDKVSSQLNIDAVALFLLNEHTQLLELAAGRGFRKPMQKQIRLNLSDSLAGRTARERNVVNIPDLTLTPSILSRNPVIAGEGFVTYYGVPLITKGMVKGILEIYQRSPLPSDPDWLGFLEALATQAAIAIDVARLFADLQRSNSELTLAYDTSLEGWSRALDMRDQETEGHSQRVTEMTMTLAQAMGIYDNELMHVYRGALLHDIGKMGIPDKILLKPGPLTPDEWVIMRQHPENAFKLLSPISHLRRALEIPYSHHEKWDGTGYPRGLKREEIPLCARIFAVVDAWDALNSDRPYRKAWSKKDAYDYILSQSGTSFDPAVVEKFQQLYPLA